MKCCVSTDVGTWKNRLTFEPDPDHSPDAGTGFVYPMAYALQCGNVKFYYVKKIPCTYWYWGQSKQQRVVLRRRNTVVGGKCALPSALLVITGLVVNGDWLVFWLVSYFCVPAAGCSAFWISLHVRAQVKHKKTLSQNAAL